MEQRLDIFISQAPVAIAMFDREMRYLAASRRWMTDYGIADRDIVGQSHYEIFPEIEERWKEAHRRGLAGEVVKAEEDRFDRADGSVQWLKWEIQPWHDAAGNIGGIIIFTEEITARKKAEERITSEAEFRSFFENVGTGAAQLGLDSRFIRVNNRLCEITGYSREEIVGRMGPLDLDHPEDRETDRVRLDRFLRGQDKVYRAEKRYLRKDGRTVWVRVTSKFIFDDQGRRRYAAVIVDDITEIKRAEEALRESVQRYELVLAGSGAGIWDWDVPGHKVVFSPQWKAMRGFSEGDIGDSEDEWTRGIHPDDAPRVIAAVQAHFEGKTPVFSEEYRVRRKDNYYIWVADRGLAVRDAEGRVVRMAGSETDISERMRAEFILRDREERLRAILNTALDAIITIDQRGVILRINPATEKMFGYNEQELLGRNIKMLMPPPYCEQHDNYLKRYLQTGEAHIIGIGREVEGRRKDGSVFPIDLAVSEIRLGDERVFSGILRDISARKAQEREIRLWAEAAEARAAEAKTLAVKVRALANEALAAEERERKRIGMLLHDDLQQLLVVLKMRVDFLEKSIGAEAAEALRDLISQAIQSTRTLSHQLAADLRASSLPLGLEMLINNMRSDYGIGIDLEIETGAEPPLDVKTFLIRATRELLLNTAKHAKASRACVKLTQPSPESIALDISDNGPGCPIEEIRRAMESPGHLGLSSLRSQAESFNGAMEIAQADLGGCHFRVVCPLGEIPARSPDTETKP